jgi:hypothetical protein
MRFIDVIVEPNSCAPEGCGLRFKTEDEPQVVTRIRFEGRWCSVRGWSSAGGGSLCDAMTAPVEDSSAGTAALVFGGDWGIRLEPLDGAPVLREPYLLLARDAIGD